jgi:hypothetical protein
VFECLQLSIMKVKLVLTRSCECCSEMDGSVVGTDSDAATVGCTSVGVAHVALFAGGLLSGLSTGCGR